MNEYGMDKCPYDDLEQVRKLETGEVDFLCYDFDDLGGLACGLCGANRCRAQEAWENISKAVDREFQKIKSGKRWRTVLHAMARK